MCDELVRYLDDTLGDLDDAAEGERFRDGYAYARHHVREFQLNYGDASADCECEYPVTEQLKGGDWVCADCDTVLLADDNPEK